MKRSSGKPRIDTAPIWILGVLFAACTLGVPNFFAWSNFANVLRGGAILALAAYGQAIVVILAGIDFSVGSSVAFGSITTVEALQHAPMPEAFLAGFATMVLVGVINGTLIAKLQLPPFLATLGMLLLLHGIASITVGGLPVEAPVSPEFYWLGRGNIAGLPVPVILAVIGAIALHVLLSHTILGRKFYLVGTNPTAARLAGVAVERTLIFGYTIGAAFVAVTGLILTARVASGQPNLMPDLPFQCMSACAIGGISMLGGKGSAGQVVIGVLIISILNNAILLLNLPTAAQLIALGTVMVGAVYFQAGSGGNLISHLFKSVRIQQ